MPPQFQSNFIPKGPTTSSPGIKINTPKTTAPKNLFATLGKLIFILSLLLAGGVFLYKFYLNHQIKAKGEELESARAALAPEVINELTSLDDRIVSTEELLRKHIVLSPLFDFLETSTPRTVRYTNFDYQNNEKGLEVTLKGEASSYAALAALAELFNQNENFREPVFSGLSLDETGNVLFTLVTTVDPQFLSYKRFILGSGATVASSSPALTATSTPGAATTTPRN